MQQMPLITDMLTLRRSMLDGARKAAASWQAEADRGLPGAAAMAARLRADVDRLAGIVRELEA